MKLTSFLVVLFGCFVAHSNAQVDIVAIVTSFFATIGQRFQCGFSAANIPVLDPLRITSDNFYVGSIGSLNSVNVSISNTNLTGLSQFTTSNITANIFGGSLGFTTVFPVINLSGSYSIVGKTNNPHSYSFSGSGTFTVAVQNLRVQSQATFTWFPTVKVLTNTRTISIASAVTNYAGITPNGATINSVLSSGAPAWVAGNQDYINSQIQGILDQYISGILNQQPNIMALITAMITFDPLVGC